ncbi:ATPase, T2SS/T4P/T4SS family [Halobacteriaceae archaeon GCM10025711]
MGTDDGGKSFFGLKRSKGDDEIEEIEGPASVGEYTWGHFELDYGADTDPAEVLGFDPADVEGEIEEAATGFHALWAIFQDYLDPATTPVKQGVYTWEHYREEFYYVESGVPPTDEEGEKIPFDRAEELGFDPDDLEGLLSYGENMAEAMLDLEDERTVNVNEEIDEDDFFSDPDGHTTITNRYDLEKAVTMDKKQHYFEIDRYWINKPYAFIIIFHSEKENEKKYYVVEPYFTPIEEDLEEFLTEKLRTAIKYTDEDVIANGDPSERREVINDQTRKLLDRYDLYNDPDRSSFIDDLLVRLGRKEPPEPPGDEIEGLSARPEPALIEEDSEVLSQYQVEKLLYILTRDFIGYERIDGIKHDINVEDISCDGYNSPVFVYHTDYEQLITNVYHGRQDLDDFVVKMAQRSGKGISKRQPQVDATLPDGSRAQLTLGREVSDHGTNYTIRQFKDVPFTPIDLVNWKTFSLEQMVFLWLSIENNKSVIFAGGTASGKTTNLNAVSLFIPSDTKIVSIEDTREVELPQRNWIASVTRPSFNNDGVGDIDEFKLLEAALRQRPDYIVMGEIRGEEGRTLFQVMSTGHTTYTTFHADNVSEVIKRFTTDPINVSKTMFSALDLVSMQTQTRVNGRKVRRAKTLTEINRYDPENDEINVQDVFEWQPEMDEFLEHDSSNTLDEIKFDRGWTHQELEDELFKRRVVLAYLIRNGLNEYTQVAATLQAFISDPDMVLTLIANDWLERSLEDLREMESVLIDVDPEKEFMVPRPDPPEDIYEETGEVLEEAEERLFDQYRGENMPDIAFAIHQDAMDGEAVAESIVEAAASDESATVDDEFSDAGQSDDPASPFAVDELDDLFGEPVDTGDEFDGMGDPSTERSPQTPTCSIRDPNRGKALTKTPASKPTPGPNRPPGSRQTTSGRKGSNRRDAPAGATRIQPVLSAGATNRASTWTRSPMTTGRFRRARSSTSRRSSATSSRSATTPSNRVATGLPNLSTTSATGAASKRTTDPATDRTRVNRPTNGPPPTEPTTARTGSPSLTRSRKATSGSVRQTPMGGTNPTRLRAPTTETSVSTLVTTRRRHRSRMLNLPLMSPRATIPETPSHPARFGSIRARAPRTGPTTGPRLPRKPVATRATVRAGRNRPKLRIRRCSRPSTVRHWTQVRRNPSRGTTPIRTPVR